MNWNENLPDPKDWQPRNKKQNELSKAFYDKCKHIEQLIRIRSKLESEMDIDNFDSGSGIEDIIREEFEKILPKRYKITKGVINDQNGDTAGDCDFIIMNDTWFPALKEGATKNSRRFHFPIESVYSIIEIKKNLTFHALDDAMNKLVVCKRLQRDTVYEWKITENSNRQNKTEESIRNQLFTGIIATNLDPKIDKTDLYNRFFEISKNIPASERINSLCILGHGTLTWGFYDKGDGKRSQKGIYTVPIYHDDIKDMQLYEYLIDKDGFALVYFISDLLTQLHYSVLNPYLVWKKYQKEDFSVKKFKNRNNGT